MRRASCAQGATDSQLLAAFHEIDEDCSGELSVAEVAKALQTRPDFAALTGTSVDGKSINKIAANLMAQNLNAAADELGNSDGLVSPDEFVLLCRRFMQMQSAQASGASDAASSSSSSSSSVVATTTSSSTSTSAKGSGRERAQATREKKKGMLGGLFSAKGDGAASRAEAKLWALRSCLERDVVSELESLLLRASEAPAEEKPRVFHEGICAVLATSRRLADAEEYQPLVSAPGSEPPGPAEEEALELLSLRRDLSTAKIALAEAQTAREEAEYALKQEQQAAKQSKTRRGILGVRGLVS